tara:strand:- start:106 stop:801 length:696 start_codon:yes stop_codon:yes gene_type:complete
MPKVDINLNGFDYSRDELQDYDGQYEHDLEAILHKNQTNELPNLSFDYKTENEMIGDHIHHYVSHKILGRDPKLNKNILEDKYETVKRCGEAILKKFVQPYVDRILGVEVNLYHPPKLFESNNKKLRADLIAYCHEPYDDCSGGWGPTCIIDWKYIGKGKKFYFDNYSHQMSLYAEAYKDRQESYHGPFLSHLLIVAVFHSGRVRVEKYDDDFFNPVSRHLRKHWSEHEYR